MSQLLVQYPTDWKRFHSDKTLRGCTDGKCNGSQKSRLSRPEFRHLGTMGIGWNWEPSYNLLILITPSLCSRFIPKKLPQTSYFAGFSERDHPDSLVKNPGPSLRASYKYVFSKMWVPHPNRCFFLLNMTIFTFFHAQEIPRKLRRILRFSFTRYPKVSGGKVSQLGFRFL